MKLVLVLGDQLTPSLSALRAADKTQDVVIMAEVRDEATYVRHHKKKIAFTFAAMRHFAQELQADGWNVVYSRYDDPAASESIPAALLTQAQAFKTDKVLTTQCGEHRLRSAITDTPLAIETLPDDRFISTTENFNTWADGRKQLRMEYFYRDMRRKTGLLMEGDRPEGGHWNYDKDNRKPAKRDLFFPRQLEHTPDQITETVLDLVEQHFPKHPGNLRPFLLATDRQGAERSAATFFETALPLFGDFQDAMLSGEAFLYHSVLSTYLNAGLLDARQLCDQAAAAYAAGKAPLNAVEGYIRQILGWREFVRGIYDREGPNYTARNHLSATGALPPFYWDPSATDMACVKSAVAQTLEYGYAHHIQRLMVTGTFALLAGVDPYALHEWYLAVYTDAYEWVEVPNVIGMSQFADGGVLASKPYAASGAYISRMSDYCAGCAYSVRKRRGPGACPFNPLYWDFLVRNREKLAGNPRMTQMYRTWDKMDEVSRAETLHSAAEILTKLHSGDRV